MNLSLPSKTFLVGEYGVLCGGPALVINSSPRFELQSGKVIDPHHGRGGFGASSIEWIENRRNDVIDAKRDWNSESAKRIIDLYKEDMWSGVGQAPSGVDIVGQITGGVALVDLSNHRLESSSWPFPHLDFFVIRTGFKIPTYQHLRNLEPSRKFDSLRLMSAEVVGAFEKKDAESFVRALQIFDSELEELGLCLDLTQILKADVQATIPDILLAKGCGALGADTVLLIFKKSDRVSIEKSLRQKSLEIVASSHDISEGVHFEM